MFVIRSDSYITKQKILEEMYIFQKIENIMNDRNELGGII